MNMKLRWTLAVAVAGALVAAAAASAARTATPMKFTATLNVGQEIPKEKGAPANAGGTFTATVTGKTLKWKLTFSHLTGAATAAHIHVGGAGKAGPVLVALCGPCKSGASGSVRITAEQMKALASGKDYVNVHTAKNPNGEIRGELM